MRLALNLASPAARRRRLLRRALAGAVILLLAGTAVHGALLSRSRARLASLEETWTARAAERVRAGTGGAAGPVDKPTRLAERVRPLGLGADLIVGFPGETDADHRASVALVEALPFTYLHVFPYSERPGASARRLGRPVDPRVAAARGAFEGRVGPSSDLRRAARRDDAAASARRA